MVKLGCSGMDTIFSLASAPGKAGISIIRISGDKAFEVTSNITGSLPDIRYSS